MPKIFYGKSDIKLNVILMITLILIILATVGSMFISVGNFHNALQNDTKTDAAALADKIKLLEYGIIIEMGIFVLFSSLLIINILSVLGKAEKEGESRNNFIDMQQSEIEKQNKLINNLTNLYNDAIEYDRLKTEFFSNTSHELKTPISVILGAVQLMSINNHQAEGDAKPEDKHLRVIRQNCYRLVRLINNLLDITRVDSGHIKVNKANCNIVYLVEEITQSVAPYAEQKKLALEFDTEFEEIIMAVDVDKIERIILNLLSNALKFTPPGGKVSVVVSSRNGKVFISVRDTGPGIPAKMHNTIFERYGQVNSSVTYRNEGSGIGLSLVKCFVELHGGNIELISSEGKGSEFVIELPVKLADSCIDERKVGGPEQSRIIEAINIEFSDIYNAAS